MSVQAASTDKISKQTAAPQLRPTPQRIRSMESESSSQLIQLTLFGLLAFIFWFVAIEQPKLEYVLELDKSVKELQKQTKELKAQLTSNNQELERVAKASPTGLQTSSMKVFQKEFEDRVVAIRSIVEDVQRQVGVERKQREELREKDRDIVGKLSHHLQWLDTQVNNLRGEVDAAKRLEKASAMLEGRLPNDGGRAASSDDNTDEEEENHSGEKASSDAQSTEQPATGGLVDVRHGDWEKLMREGDSWVVMFYAPWCGHCKAAAPVFQQAALQAPVHFARIDAAAHPAVAESEKITVFPTIRFYSKGKVVRYEFPSPFATATVPVSCVVVLFLVDFHQRSLLTSEKLVYTCRLFCRSPSLHTRTRHRYPHPTNA